MKLPYLKIWDNIPVSILVTSGLDENGEKRVVGKYDGLCNYNEKSTTRMSADGQLVTLSGVLYVQGDIFPEIPYITGIVEIEGNNWNIYSSSRPRNPDGTVHHTRIELM